MSSQTYFMNKEKMGRDIVEHAAANRQCEIITLDGYDAAIIGVTEINGEISACYSEWDICKILESRDKMKHDDAQEFVSFNIEPLCGGVGKPILIET